MDLALAKVGVKVSRALPLVSCPASTHLPTTRLPFHSSASCPDPVPPAPPLHAPPAPPLQVGFAARELPSVESSAWKSEVALIGVSPEDVGQPSKALEALAKHIGSLPQVRVWAVRQRKRRA